MSLQNFFNALSDAGLQERKNYHATFGDLIDKLKVADESLRITPAIVGIGAYRGYYSDIALCTNSGSNAYKQPMDYESPIEGWEKWEKENTVNIDFTGTPKQLAEKLESFIGYYFDGYKGGFNKITRDKPLWLATDYGNCSDMAIIQITDKLELITKQIE